MSIPAIQAAIHILRRDRQGLIDAEFDPKIGDVPDEAKPFIDEYDAAIAGLETLQADQPACWVYPEFFGHLDNFGTATAYLRDGTGPHPDGIERIPLWRGPTPKPLTFPQQAAAFKRWYDAWWIGDGEQGEYIPDQADPKFTEYLNGYTLAFGAWCEATRAAAGIKEAA